MLVLVALDVDAVRRGRVGRLLAVADDEDHAVWRIGGGHLASYGGPRSASGDVALGVGRALEPGRRTVVAVATRKAGDEVGMDLLEVARLAAPRVLRHA